MATTPGQKFVRRHDAARSSTANTTAADITYDTAVFSEGGYSWSSPEVTVDEAGLYLTIFDLGHVSLSGSSRAVGTLVPSINTTDQTRFRASHRYLRNSGGAIAGPSIGMAVLDLSASDDVKVRNPGVLTPTDSLGNYATPASAGGAIQLIRLPEINFTHVERTVDATEVGLSQINTTRPWVDASGSWTKITYNSEVRDDDSLNAGSGNITLAANKKYMIVWGATIYSTNSNRMTHIVRLSIDGNNVQSASGYQRNAASQGPPCSGMYLHEVGGSPETLFLEATTEAETVTPAANVSDAYLQVIELPDSAEWIHVDNSTTDSLTTALAGTGTWYDIPLSSTLRADGNSDLSLDSGNDAVQNDSGGTLSVLAIGWERWDRDSTASANRKEPRARWDNGGAAVNYGVAGAFSRGQQSDDDTWQAHFVSVVALDLANAADLSFQVNEPANAGNSDMGIYASTNRFFLGVQVLNLDTLVDAAPAGDIAGSTSIAFTDPGTSELTGGGELQGAASVAFTDPGTSDLTGSGELKGAAAIAFSETGTGFRKRLAQASVSIAFSQTGAIEATGSLVGSTSIDFSETGAIEAIGSLVGSTSIDFSETGTPFGTGLVAGVGIGAFSATGDIKGAGALAGSAEIAFSVTATAVIDNSIAGSTSIAISETGLIWSRPKVWINTVASLDGNEIELPWTSYSDTSITFNDTPGPPTGAVFIGVQAPSGELAWSVVQTVTTANDLAGLATIAFGETGDLNGLGDLAGSAAITFAETSVLQAIGSLAGSTSIEFSETGTPFGTGLVAGVAIGAFSATGSLSGLGELASATSIEFGETADLNATGTLAGTAAIAFGETGAIEAVGSLAGSASIAFSETGTPTGTGLVAGTTFGAFSATGSLSGLGSLAAAASISFSETGTTTGTGLVAGVGIGAFSASGTLSGLGEIAGATTIAFSESADITGLEPVKGDWGAVSISPLVLPIRAYVFAFSQVTILGSETIAISVTGDLNAVGSLSGSASIAFGETGAVEGSGELAGSPVVALSASGDLLGLASLSGSTSIAFALNGVIGNPLVASTAIAFSETGDLKAVGSLAGASVVSLPATATLLGRVEIQASASISLSTTSDLTNATPERPLDLSPLILPIRRYSFISRLATRAVASIDFGGTATLSAMGSLQASATISWSTNGTPIQPRPLDLSPLILPIRRYDFSSPKLLSLAGAASIAFGHTASLTSQGGLSPDNIFGSTSIVDVFDTYVWIFGTGQLLGSTGITFGGTGVVDPNAIQGAGTIAFDVNAMLTAASGGIASIAGSTSIAFSAVGNGSGTQVVVGATSVAFSASGDLVNSTGVKLISGFAEIRFSAGGSKFIQMQGSTSIDFVAIGDGAPRSFGDVEDPTVMLLGVEYDLVLPIQKKLGVFIDDFDRAGPAIGGGWEEINNPYYELPIIETRGEIKQGELLLQYSAAYRPTNFGADHYVEMTIKNWGVATDEFKYIWSLVRGGDDKQSGYYLYVTGNTAANQLSIQINRWDAPETYILLAENLGPLASPLPDGTKFKLTAVGDVITGYMDTGSGYVQKVQTTDSTYQTENGVQVGLEAFPGETDIAITRFEAQEIRPRNPSGTHNVVDLKEYDVISLPPPQLTVAHLNEYDIIKLGE